LTCTRRRRTRRYWTWGIDTLTAAGLCAEIGTWDRFRPKRLSGFLGIVPTEHTSADKRRQGAISKARPAHARRLLVEAARHYRHQPAIGDALARRQHDQDPRVIEIAGRAQRRLHQRWQLLAGHRRSRRDRLRPRARRLLLGGRHPELNLARQPRATGAAGARARPPGLRLVATSSPRSRYGQPPLQGAGGARS
jgi:hypothetical protein